MPIGNLISQYLANHYLSGLDHYIKRKLRIPGYVRYMDDLVLWAVEKEKLKKACRSIQEFVENELLCELKPIMLNRTAIGLPFLGFRIFPDYLHLNANSRKRFIRKMRRIDQKYQTGEWDEATCQRRGMALIAFVQFADSNGLLRKVKNRN